jgi:antimicrobial peptide system SdpA family protein
MANRESVYTSSALRRLGTLVLTLGVGMFLLVSYALHGAATYNPLRLPLEQQVQTQRWLPQGWSFFTRDPTEERLLVYHRDADGRWSSPLLTPHGRPDNAFGMNRASRAQGVEVGQLYERVHKSAFTPCTGGIAACLEALAPAKRLENAMPRKTLCGSIALVKQRPLPWAWNAWKHKSRMPARAARLEVQC